ncbi:MAG: hypothetical protein II655_10940, partial [Thermoguttaceae bacterium]|nr:hypothetical protein [Thermoguttaceae bacterium]
FVMAKNRCLAPKSAQSKRRRLQPERHATFRNATSYKKYTDFTSSSGENEKFLLFSPNVDFSADSDSQRDFILRRTSAAK